MAGAAREDTGGGAMMEARLQTQLGALAQMLRRARLWRALASCWAVAAAVGLALLVIQSLMGREFHLKLWVMPLAVGLVYGRCACSCGANGRPMISGT